MNLKKNHYSRRALALLLTLVMCVGMIPTAFAAQQNSYHDPAEHWMQASGRTNELDANSVVTRETFKCGECGKATSFEVFRVPEYRAAKRGADGVSAAAVLCPNGGRDSYQATESGHPQRKKPLCLRRAIGQTAASGKPWKEKSGSVGSAPDS